ncbi:beta-1,2-xylosyltransferase XYXT1-like [Triticum dicoccoides]|uniref:beta-1,2-xylosyltransferase XYXT1-like n=1 Tax=Triticum dicoccoides TaxID=85692 RepID=UPI00188E4A4C|nr:beta-1,2-xylosyltransferase XYXT1-like [Triticum dicoccoides]
MEGGKAAAYAHHHDTARLLKAFSRTVEPRNFGIGLVAGFLLVTCAYFSTAKFDAIHIAPLVSPLETRIGSPVSAAAAGSKTQLDLGVLGQDAALSGEGSKAEVLDTDGDDHTTTSPSSSSPQDLVHDASLADTKKDDTFARDGDAAAVEAAKDDDAAGALLPPLSANGTQEEQGVLEDQELLVQDAIAAANSPNKSSSNGGSQSVVQSDPATIPAPVQQTPPTVPVPEAPKQIPLTPEAVKQQPGSEEAATAPRREGKPLCDLTSNRRIDWCELDGDVRVHGAKATVTLVGAPQAEEWRIRPYPRKVDPNAMRHVTNITVRSTTTLPGAGEDDECAIRHSVPALLFSDRGYTGNYFHAYTDVILPLFLTAKQYGGEVQFLVSDLQMWWVGKFLPVFKSLSNYDLVDLAADNRTRCFRHVQVGLTCHADFSIDPLRAPNGYSMVDFTKHMRGVYGLPRGLAVPATGARPRLLLIARASTRRFVNADDIVRAAQKVGFEVVVSEGTHEVAPFAELANTCDAMLGVHGAGLTNMVFLPTGGVVIQVVPLGGLEFVAGYFRTPSRDMGLKYLEYRIAPAESTLTEQYPPDHAIFTDPDGVKSKGWESLKQVYLDKQDVRLDLKRFRPLLKKAIAHIRANKLQ